MKIHLHEFKRDRNGSFCYLCQDSWPANETAVSKYDICVNCGVTVHTGCRDFARTCYPCEISTNHQKLTSQYLHDINCSGRVFASLIHAYDMGLPSGTQLYGIFKVSTCQDVYQTNLATMGEHDCVWDTSHKVAIDSNGIPSSPQRNNSTDESLIVPSSRSTQPSLRHIHHPRDSSGAVFAPPLLHLEIWKSFFGLFDSVVAKCDTSLLPLLLHPTVPIERWFGLKNNEGTKAGMILLNLCFIPDELPAPHTLTHSVTPPVKERPIVTLSVIESSSDDGDGEENDNVQNHIVSRRNSSIDVPESIVDRYREESETHSSLFTEIVSSSSNETPSGRTLIVVEPHSISTEGMNAELSDESVAASAVPSADIVSYEKENTLGNSTPVDHSNSLLSIKENVDMALMEKVAQTDSNLQIPSQTNSKTKWQEWLQSTTEQLAKNVKERSTQAMDVLNTITSSNAIRKRKRNSTSKNNSVESGDTVKQTGIGILHVELISAYKSFAQDAAEGDHFAVVNLCTAGSLSMTEPLIDSEQERETQIIHSSATPVFNEKYEFTVPSYRSAVKFTLVDAISEKKVGYSVVHLYSLIQRDADKFKGKWDVAEIENIPMRDFGGKTVIGHFTVRVRFQEDIQGLFLSSDPRKAPPGPSEAMSLERVQVHVRRFGKFIGVISKLFGRYRSLMDWENPPFTFGIFVLFVYFTLYLDAEYALCAPLFLCVALMTETWFHREFGYFKKKWVVTEDDSLNYPYRPVSYLRLAIAGFRNFGLNGSPKAPPPYVRITFLPNGDNSGKISTTTQPEYHIATFSTSQDRNGGGGGLVDRDNMDSVPNQKATGGIGQFISSLSLSKSDVLIKDALLQNVSDPWLRRDLDEETSSTTQSRPVSSHEYVDISYLYPILKQICDEPNPSSSNEDKQKSKKKKTPNFIPWSKSPAVIKFTFHGDNPLATFLDNAWGSVQIPISDLVRGKGGVEVKHEEVEDPAGVQPEVRIWKDIIWTSAHLQRLRSMQEEEEHYVENIGDLDNPYHAIFAPRDLGHNKPRNSAANAQVLLRLQLDERQSSQKETLQEDFEVSRVVQSIIMPKNEKSETTISAIWNARDHIKYVQNLLGGVIDKLESLKNVFNWTIPSKTFPIYALLVGTWLATILIPGRYLILLVGFSEFFFVFMPQPEELPLSIKVMNLIMSLPNDDDLFEIYRQERETNCAAFEEKQKERLKQVKLRLVLDCRWDSAVNIKQPGTPSVWMPAFLVIQGHRLVWWATENDVHEGNAPVGEILLQGHAGTTHASPVEIREVGNDLRLVVVFGRDAHGGQIKRTILCKDAESCEALKAVVNNILSSEGD